MPPKPNPFTPTVRVAPLGEVDASIVYEYELDRLAEGAGGSQLLNLAYALIPFSGAFVITLLSTDIASGRVFNVFVLRALVTGSAGVICLALGRASYRSNQALLATIKRRMPPSTSPAP